jgi:hypothetical protein
VQQFAFADLATDNIVAQRQAPVAPPSRKWIFEPSPSRTAEPGCKAAKRLAFDIIHTVVG